MTHDLQALGGETATYERLRANGLRDRPRPFLAPFATARAAWDLQRVNCGRLLLGLGIQERAHAEFEHRRRGSPTTSATGQPG